MTGAETKRQVMEALDADEFGYARGALAPCIILTAEEAAKVRGHLAHADYWEAEAKPLCAKCDALALLTPEEAAPKNYPAMPSSAHLAGVTREEWEAKCDAEASDA